MKSVYNLNYLQYTLKIISPILHEEGAYMPLLYFLNNFKPKIILPCPWFNLTLPKNAVYTHKLNKKRVPSVTGSDVTIAFFKVP